jgi:hypothetical protein
VPLPTALSGIAPVVGTDGRDRHASDLLVSAIPATVATPSATPSTVRALRTRCDAQFGHVTRRSRCTRSDAGRRESLPEVSLLPGIPGDRALELSVRQLGPQSVGKPELRLRRLKRKEAAQAPVPPVRITRSTAGTWADSRKR